MKSTNSLSSGGSESSASRSESLMNVIPTQVKCLKGAVTRTNSLHLRLQYYKVCLGIAILGGTKMKSEM